MTRQQVDRRAARWMAMAMATAAASLAACSTAAPSPSPQPPAASPRGAPTSAASSAPTVSEAAAPAAKPATLQGAPPPGTFSCGDQFRGYRACQVGAETCCEGDRCVPRGAEPESCVVRHECDTTADCPDGQTCCMSSHPLERPYYARRCEAKTCRQAESCRKGTCPTGQRCSRFDAPGPVGVGSCVAQHGEVACGAQTCRGPTPYCAWNRDTRSGECIADDGSASPMAYLCDDDGDCLPGERCWLATVDGSFCCRGESCLDEAAYSRFTRCRTAKDCPVLEGIRFSCKPDPDLPPSIPRRCFPTYVRRANVGAAR